MGGFALLKQFLIQFCITQHDSNNPLHAASMRLSEGVFRSSCWNVPKEGDPLAPFRRIACLESIPGDFIFIWAADFVDTDLLTN